MNREQRDIFWWILDEYAQNPRVGINLMKITNLWPDLADTVRESLASIMNHSVQKYTIETYASMSKTAANLTYLDILRDQIWIWTEEARDIAWRKHYGIDTEEKRRKIKLIRDVYRAWHTNYVIRTRK